MKKKIKFLIIFLILLSLLPLQTQGASSKKKLKDLPEKYRKWLQEEVVYIISPREKDVFLQLETDRERDIFIEAFWKQRDPTPNSPENEFKKEHYRRISYANHYFGRESAIPGWRTDRGRIYIILGPPKDIESYVGLKQLYSTEVWTYQGDPALGLPPQFNLVFFQKNGVGDYVLYSPIKDGPASLIPGFSDPTNVVAAYKQLNYIEPKVASVSLSLIPGTQEQFDPYVRSFASDVLVSAKIPASAYEKVETAYAEKLLRYKDIIEVEYTANYISSDSAVKVLRDKSGIFFVHYMVEPKRLSIEQYEDRFYTTLELNGMISDAGGNMVYQFRKKLPVEFKKEQIDKIKTKLFSFQDMFPLVEGTYSLHILLKNNVSKEFTSFEKNITVPLDTSLQMSSLILANRIRTNSKYGDKTKPFLVNNIQLVPSPRNDFSRSDTLYLFFQVYGLDQSLINNGSLRYTLYREGEVAHSFSKNVKDYQEAPDFLERIDLSLYPPAYYKIQVSLFDDHNNELLSEQENFLISHYVSLPRPWILSEVFPSSKDPVYSNILGNQLLNQKQISKSIILLEDAYQRNHNSLKFGLDYARALFLSHKYRKAKEVLEPFSKNENQSPELLALLGSACQKLEQHEEAIAYFKQHLSRFGTNLKILNAIGQNYLLLGKPKEALVALEKSLELNPEQEEIKELVELIKKKKQ